MLDFATLTQARQGLQKSDSLRHQQSAEMYTQGRQLIRDSLRQPVDKAKLKQATDCFTKGIQANYKNPSNYFGMGFLFLLINQHHQALPYINSGLDLEPKSELGKELLRQARVVTQPTQAPKVPAPQLPQVTQVEQATEEMDFDDLYDNTESALMLFLRQLMADEVMFLSPSPNPKQLDLLHAKLKIFQDKMQEFNQRLQILDQEIEVSGLKQHLGKIDKAVQRISTLMRLCEQFLDIHQDIQKHTDLTVTIITEAQTTEDPNDIAVLEENLQVLLDHCDCIADRLDELDAKKINISPLQSPYQQYAEQLERFQDVLEETIDRLKSV